MKKMIVGFFALCLVLTILSRQDRSLSAENDAKKLFEKRCGLCHPIDRPKSKKKTREDWEKTVTRMKNVHKAPISDEEAKVIVDYLSENYGK